MVIILNCSILDSLEKSLLLSAYNGNSLGSFWFFKIPYYLQSLVTEPNVETTPFFILGLLACWEFCQTNFMLKEIHGNKEVTDRLGTN